MFMSFIFTGTTPQLLLTKAERLSWPELVGRKGTYAVQYIKEKTGKYSLKSYMKMCF
jgi:hypothetical protein